MVTRETCTGINRHLFNLKTYIDSIFHYVPHLIKGELSLIDYFKLLYRMSIYAGTLNNNKFVKVNGKMRLGLYVSAYGTKPYWITNDKLFNFKNMMPPSTVVISITSACRNKCEHCYQKNDKGQDINIDEMIKAVQKIQEMGVPFCIIEGGDTFLVYERLKKLVSSIDDRSEIWVNTTGDEVTLERMMELKKMGISAVRFSLHHHDPAVFNQFMGVDWAWDNLIKGTTICNEVGVPVVFNACINKEGFYNGDFEKIMDKARELNGVIIEVIHPKRAGGWLSQEIEQFSEKDFDRVKSLVYQYNFNPEYKDYPMISCQIIEESVSMYGCSAGGVERFYINAKGDVQPCEFLNISFGNIEKEEFETIYKRMREQFMPPCETWLCDKYCTEIYKVARKNNVTVLPLGEELSKQVYMKWDRGTPTRLYEKLYFK